MKIITSVQLPLDPPSHERHKSMSSRDGLNPFVTLPCATLSLYLEAFMKYVAPLLYFSRSHVIRRVFDNLHTNPHMLPEKMANICLILAIGAQHCDSSHYRTGLLCFNAALANLQLDTPNLDCNCLEILALVCLYTMKDRPQDSYLSICRSKLPISRMNFNRLRRYRHRHWEAGRS